VICDPWIDRSPPAPKQPRAFKRDAAERAATQDRRATLRAAGRCINGPLVGNVGHKGVVHGEVAKHSKCQRCLDVYAESA
jgi:hypothetical protein